MKYIYLLFLYLFTNILFAQVINDSTIIKGNIIFGGKYFNDIEHIDINYFQKDYTAKEIYIFNFDDTRELIEAYYDKKIIYIEPKDIQWNDDLHKEYIFSKKGNKMLRLQIIESYFDVNFESYKENEKKKYSKESQENISKSLITINDNEKSNFSLEQKLYKLDKKQLSKFQIKKEEYSEEIIIVPKKSSVLIPFLVIDGDKLFFKVKIKHFGDNWLFYNSVTMLANKDTFRFDPKNKIEEVLDSGRIYESSINNVDSKMLNFLKTIVKDNYLTFRLDGDTYYKYYDYKSYKSRVIGISDVLDLYGYLLN